MTVINFIDALENPVLEALLDATALTLFSAPIIYVWVIYPYVTERRRAEDSLHKEKEEQKILIDKLKNAQAQLLQSEKMASIGQLAAGIAHEINNPVGYISSNIHALERYVEDIFKVVDAYEQSAPSKENHAAFIKQIKQEVDLDFLRGDIAVLLLESEEGVNRVKQIVNDLKDFSHVDEAEWQWANLHKGLDSTLNIVQNEVKYKADIIKEYGDIPDVKCLASQLNQVFMNLLINAAHAIEGRGTITLRTSAENDEVRIEVIDTGKGIEEQNLTRIFEPFFTTKPIGKGTGLGLSLSYGIINKHHGRIEIESEVGKGTCFRVVLPVEQEQTEVALS